MQNGVKIDIRIQSASDIITNSSSEVYLRTNYNCVEDFKKIIDALAGEGFSNNFVIEDHDDCLKIEAKSKEYDNIATILKNINLLFYASD